MDNSLKTNHAKRTQRDYSLPFKQQVVQEVELGELSASAAQKKYGIHGSLIPL